jgi:hypothetical protein
MVVTSGSFQRGAAQCVAVCLGLTALVGTVGMVGTVGAAPAQAASVTPATAKHQLSTSAKPGPSEPSTSRVGVHRLDDWWW